MASSLSANAWEGCVAAGVSFAACATLYQLSTMFAPAKFPASYASTPAIKASSVGGKDGSVKVEDKGKGKFAVTFQGKTFRVVWDKHRSGPQAGESVALKAVDEKVGGAIILTDGSAFENPEGGKPERAYLWHTTTVALLPTVFVPYFALPGMQELADPLNMVGGSNRNLAIGLGLSLGYMAFDTLIMLVKPKEMTKALGGAFYQQMMWHHGLSILLWPYAFYSERCVNCVAYFMVTEVTNIVLNSRWFMVEHGVTGTLPLLWNLALLVIYTACRIAPIPWIIKMLATNDWSGFGIMHRIATAFCVVPMGLNVFWYYLILRGGYRVLFESKKTDKVE